MCLRKLSAPFFACLILILPIPVLFDTVVGADPGKRAHGSAIIVQPGQEVIVTDTASGPSPQEAEATALDAKRGKSRVLNNGTVRAGAEADTTATAKGALAGARSVGINGSAGSDSLVNNGTLSSKADAAITSLTLFVNIDGFTLPFMRKFPAVTGGSLAESFAAGILGGCGNDAIEHSGIMTVEAASTAAAGNIQVNLAGRNEKVFSKAIPAAWAVKPPVMKADAPGKAVSEVVGIDGGPGNDSIRSISPMTVAASAVSGAGSLNMNLGNDARADLSAEASAAATGIRGNEGDDEIVNQGTMRVEASAVAGAGAVTAAYPTDRGIYGLPVQPPAKGKVQSPYFTVQGDLSGRASAETAGLSGNEGDDSILNTAPVDVAAAAVTGAGSVSVGVGTGAEANVSAEAVSSARGIQGGEGDDTIGNEGTLSVDASSIAGAGSIGVGVSGGAEGKAAAKADASGTAAAEAVGISGDSGRDDVTNIAPLTVRASSTVGAGSISVGVATGAEADVSAEATAGAAGIRGGAGSDAIRSEGALRAQASSIAVAGSIGVGVSGGAGESAPAKADASATTGAGALGIGGGEGHDAIVNMAPATVTASASTWAGSISVGIGAGAEADVSAEATARAAGIHGGEGNDELRNEGTLTVTADAAVGAGSIGVGVSGGEGEDESAPVKADASAKAFAAALGIGGGAGDDVLVNIGPTTVKASSTAGAGSISVGVGGNAEGSVSAEAITRAAGIEGGKGEDGIRNEGTLTVEAASIAGAGSIAVGVANGDDQENQAETPSGPSAEEESPVKAGASAKALASALGIGGGPGHDTIVNVAPLTVKASSTVGAGSISVGVGTGAEADVSAESITRTAGIRGGEGSDAIRNEGTLTVESASIAGAGSIGVGVAGDEGGSSDAKGDASGTARADAVGISGGSGPSAIVNIGPLNVKASSTVGAGSIDVSVGGDVEGKASAEATAGTAGIRGGDKGDEILNQGTLNVQAASIAVAGSIGVGTDGGDDGGQNGSPPEPPSLETSSVKAETKAVSKAQAAGIDGGEGNNRIASTAPMTVTSTATTVAGSIGVKVSGLGGGDDGGGAPSGGGQEQPEMPELSLSSVTTDASAKAEARAAGIRAGGGADTISSGGDLTVEATSTAVAAGVSVNVANVDKGLSGSAALADAGAAALSSAAGIDGGDGDNGIANSAAIGTKATATAVGVGIGVDVGIAKKGAALGAAIADSRTTAEALASGIRSGTGKDRILNTGAITPEATANATAVSVGLSVTNAEKGLAVSAALADADASAKAAARGIESGAGDDVIQNTGSISPKAKAGTTAVGVDLGVGVTEQGVSLGASLVESNASSAAAAVGIDSGKGSDRVTNTGQIALDSQSSATAVSVGLSVTYAKQGAAVSVAVVEAQSAADATARGIEAGEGDDVIANEGTIQGVAKADTTSVGVSVGVGIAKQGLAAGVGLSDTSTGARALSVGIDGGAGEDRIVNRGAINLGLESGFGSVANADAVSVGVTVAGASQGLAGAAALSKSSATGIAETTGITGGEGHDRILNFGTIGAGAKADVDSTNVAVTATIAKEGLAGGAALSDTEALAAAAATGIDGAGGDDRILNAGEIKSQAESLADTVSVTVNLNGTKTGLTGGAALSDTSALATATARGIEGAAGNDRIVNESLVEANADSRTDTTSVTVTIAGALTGVAGGAALSDSASVSAADAAGLSGGAGHDRILNTGKVVSGAYADADATAVTVGLTLAKTGVAAGAALSDASSSSQSAARGIDGGDGDDRITNRGAVDARAESRADTVSVTVGVNGSLTGVAGGAALSDAAAAAVADAAGITGGSGSDEISNAASVASQAVSSVDTTAVTVTLSVSKEGVSAGAALSDASSAASSAARGIDGGAGDDRIRNDGEVTASANAAADTTSVVVQVAGSLYGAAGGLAMSDSSAAALAQAAGIAGGAGNDAIINSAKITAVSTADVDAKSIAVTASGSIGLAGGAAFSDASVDSRAQSRGIDGGDGCDGIVNSGEIVSGATATGKATSVSVDVALGAGGGASFSDSSAVVSADSAGIDGGGGHDRIANSGPVTATATTDADVSSVSVQVGAALSAGASFGDASVVSTTAARGIGGGDGNDRIVNEGGLLAAAMSRVDADSVTVNVGAGWAEAKAAIASLTAASGIEGGRGDDTIVNRGEIRVGPAPGLDPWMARITASSFTFGLSGVANAQSSMLATTRSTGIDGGDGNDRICNEGLLNVRANSISSVSADSVIVFGTSSGAVLAGAVAEAQGITGGAGDDAIANAAAITANSTASVILDSSSFSFGGTGNTGGLLAGTARSTGISGGDGSDFIRNDGGLSLTATAALASTSDADVAFGSSGAGSTSGAIAEAEGISGGAGNDAIANAAAITANSTASVILDSSSFSFGGTGDTGGQLTATARSTGISGGDGADFIRNDGSLSLTAAAALTSRANADVAFGSSGAGSTSGAVAEAAGISGGAGDDRIENNGSIRVTPSSTLTVTSSSFSFGGTGASGTTLAATTSATGISGGDGADLILNRGPITLQADSTLTTGSSSDAAFGTSSGTVISGGVSQAVGIDGGAGDDRIFNAGALVVGSSSALNLKASGFTFGGTSGAQDALTADSRSVGISGGSGATRIYSQGVLTVTASSSLTAKADVDAAFGATVTYGITSADAKATGISGGEEGDCVENLSDLTVTALSGAEIGKSTYVFGGTASSNGQAATTARAEGIAAGDGDNRILNGLEGTVHVKAEATAKQSGSSTVTFGPPAAGADAKAAAFAAGITGGGGNDWIVNLGTVEVNAYAKAEGEASAGAFWGSPRAIVNTGAEATATGIDAGAGNNVIVNAGQLTVKAETEATGRSWAEEDAGDLATEEARATAKAVSTARGITAGNGDNLIVNNGSIAVTAAAKPTAVAETEDNDVERRSPSGTARALGIQTGSGNDGIVIGEQGSLQVNALGQTATVLTGLSAVGIDAGAGHNRLILLGSAAVTASHGDAVGLMAAGDVSALGIQAAEGNDSIAIANTGRLNVDALATGGVLFGGSGETSAVGIDAGHGDNVILSDGAIGVRSIAFSGSVGGAEAPAYGIRTGDGSDRIENRGTLSVFAEATTALGSSDASATGIAAGHGDNVIRNDGTIDVTARSAVIIGSARARAYGILTGDGNDTVTNAGIIRTSQTGIATGVSIETPGVAIGTGGGNDRVTLEAGSLTRGIIDLGSGDDAIAFNGSLAVTGNVTGGAGGDTLVFSGDGALGAPLSGFETAVKDGAGTYAVNSLAPVRRLEMNGGSLAVAHSYQIPADGVFQARVSSDGSHGRFNVDGAAGLDGALTVLRGKGVYADGTRYPILTANTVSGWFTSETLPAPVPLLSFSVAGFSDRVEVEAHAKSCTTVAANPGQMRIAQMLDKAMATATGKTADMLGEFQALPARDFQKAFASFDPNTYDRFRKASLAASRENIRSLHNRMTALRLSGSRYSAAAQARAFANTLSLFKAGADAGMDPDQAWQLGRLSSAETQDGGWMSAFGQRAGFAGAGGQAGYDYRMNGTVIGYDQLHGDGLITGFSSGFSRGSVGIEDRTAAGSLDGASSSIYGSWSAGETYLESALSLTRNHYENRRSIVVGSFAQSAAADHEGNLFAAYLSGGRYIDVSRWVVEPYVSMLFTQSYEEGFQESGDGLSLRIHGDRARSLLSDAGLRIARSYESPFGRLIPEAGVAWVYDFRLDDRRVTASLAGVEGSEFSLAGEQTGRHGARFETGLSWLGEAGFSASLKYTGEFRSGADDQGVFGYLRYEF